MVNIKPIKFRNNKKGKKLLLPGIFILLFAGLGITLLLHSRAAFPGQNGKILFGQSGGGVYTVNSDGSGYQLLANDGSTYYRYSPRGDKIAYRASDGNVWAMN